MLKHPYRSEHGFNRMRSEGDVGAARLNFFKSRSYNLKFLLNNGFAWMNDYIKPEAKGVEVGSGVGLSKLFIKADNFLLTDYAPNDWLDVQDVDALKTPFPDASFDFVVSSNMIHHVPYPARFFEEIRRILKPGGVIAKTVYIPLPVFALKVLKFVDDILAKLFPRVFALQRQIVLRKV